MSIESNTTSQSSINPKRKITLLIGSDPALIDLSSPEFAAFPGMTAAKVLASLDAAVERTKFLGNDAHHCLTDSGQTAEAVVIAQLQQREFDRIMIGAGVRTVPSHFIHFERLINVVHKHSPRSSICLNTQPSDTLEALQRWI